MEGSASEEDAGDSTGSDRKTDNQIIPNEDTRIQAAGTPSQPLVGRNNEQKVSRKKLRTTSIQMFDDALSRAISKDVMCYDSVLSPIVILQSNFEVLSWNSSLVELTGVEEESVKG